MWLIAGVLALGVVFLFASTYQQSNHEARMSSGECPACKIDLLLLQPDRAVQPPRSWEVLACRRCELSTTAVQGVPGAAGWCPSCRQHALELSAQRLPASPSASIRVQVAEKCHLCSHDQRVLVEHHPASRERGKVIPFPRDSV